MNKYLNITLADSNFINNSNHNSFVIAESDSMLFLGDSEYPPLFANECRNIVDQIYKQNGKSSTREDLQNAIDVIVTCMYKYSMNCITVDISKRNNKLSPVKKMTLEDIEDVLGYKIQIINKQED